MIYTGIKDKVSGIQVLRDQGQIQSGGWSNTIRRMVQSILANGQIEIISNKIMGNMIASTDKVWKF
jgi:hypothetical protein